MVAMRKPEVFLSGRRTGSGSRFVRFVIACILFCTGATIPGAAPLFSDSFARTTIGPDWTVVDDPDTTEASDWRVGKGVLYQNSNIYRKGAKNANYQGTHIVCGSKDWTDYSVSSKVKPMDDDGWGVIVRYRDPRNFYRFFTVQDKANDGPFMRIEKFVDDVPTILAQLADSTKKGRGYSVKVTVTGNRFDVSIDGVMVLSAVDPEAWRSGKTGFCTFASSVEISDFVVDGPASPPPSITRVDNAAVTPEVPATVGRYENPGHVYSMMLPAGWALMDSDPEAGTDILAGTDDPSLLIVCDRDGVDLGGMDEDRALEVLTQALAKSYPSGKTGPSVLGSLRAVMVSSHDRNRKLMTWSWLVPTGGRAYQINAIAVSESPLAAIPEILRKVLASFSVTPVPLSGAMRPDAAVPSSSGLAGTAASPAIAPRNARLSDLDIKAPMSVSIELPPDPSRPGTWNSADLLWSPFPVVMPSASSPSVKASTGSLGEALPFDASSLSLVAYNGSITTCKEGLRLVMGPMSSEEEIRYEKKWAPFYDHPDDGILAYLGKLSPLLAEFLAARGAFASLSQGVAGCLAEAAACELEGEAIAARIAMGNALSQKVAMDVAESRMARAARAVLALGTPPDPFMAKAKRRSDYARELSALKPVPETVDEEGELYWELTGFNVETMVFPDGNPDRAAAARNARSMKTVGPKCDFFWSTTIPSGRSGSGSTEKVAGFFDLSSVVPPPLLKYEGSFPVFPVLVRMRLDEDFYQIDGRNVTGEPWGSIRLFNQIGLSRSLDLKHGMGDIDFRFRESDLPDPAPWPERYYPPITTYLQLDTRSGRCMVTMEYTLLRIATVSDSTAMKLIGSGKRINPRVVVDEYAARMDEHVASTLGMSLSSLRRNREELAYDDSYIATYSEFAVADAPRAAGAAAKKAEREAADAVKAVSRAQKEEAARSIDANVAYFQSRLDATKTALAGEKDPGRRGYWEFQLMSYDAYINASKDEKRELETGIYSRTRTMADEWNMREMMRHGEEEAERISSLRRLYNAASSLVNLAPEDQREDMQAFYSREIGSDMSPAHVREVARRLADKVREANSRDFDTEMNKARRARMVELGLEGVKMTGGIAVASLGGTVFAGYGLSGLTMTGIDMVFGAMYGGATGYVEGGPAQALKQSMEWAGTAGFVASQALDGWAETGSASGAASSGAAAYLVGKSFELAGKWASGKVASLFGKEAAEGAGAVAVQRTGPGIPGSRALEIQSFLKSAEGGRKLATELQKTEWRLAEAVSKGRPFAEVEALQNQARALTLQTSNNWFAKLSLKLQGRGVGGAAYCERMEREIQEAMPEVLDLMKLMGHDTKGVRFRSMRNSASSGTAGMDMDIGLDEAARGLVARDAKGLAKFGSDAQLAFNEVWRAKTGYSAPESLINITTSVHRESFANTLLLKSEIPWEKIPAADIQQAARIMRTKVADVDLPGMAGFVERCRSIEKEMRTKFLPYLDNRIAGAKASGNLALENELKTSKAYWNEYYGQFGIAAKKGTNGVLMAEVRERLSVLSGGREPLAIADDLLEAWSAMTMR